MTKKITTVILLAVSALCLNARNITHKLLPSDDTYTYSNSTIRGMEDLLKTYHSTAGSQYRRISFLKFDISGLSPFVQDVKLRLYANGFPAGGDNAHQFDLYPVQINTWSEDDLSFANFTEKAGADMTSPVLASYSIAAGSAFGAQYIEFSGANLTKYVTDSLAAGMQYISIRMREKYVVKKGSDAVIVEFHSKENASGFAPELVIAEKDVDGLKAADIWVDGATIAGFSENTYRYVYKLAWNETVIPIVSATAKEPGSTTVNVVQATSLTGTEANRTAKIAIQNGADALTYSVVFELLPPPNDARLSEIRVNGEPVEFFDKEKTTYTVYLPYTETQVPTVAVLPYEPSAAIQITHAGSIDAAEPEASRTTILNVTSGDGSQTKAYRIVFQRLPELDIILALGQSNMAGRASFANYAGSIDGVYLLTPAGGMEIASNPMNKYSNIRKDISLQGLSPSYSCAVEVQKQAGKPLAFVVNAQGGSSITTWYQAGKSNYDASIVRAKEAQCFGKIRAVIWHQGESDSGNPGAYMDRLKTLVQSLRNDLNEPDLYFVAGELAYWRGGGTGSDAFNAIIRTISSEITNSDWVSAEGCTPMIDASDPHLDAASDILLGERYAEKIIRHIYDTSFIKTEASFAFPAVQAHKNGISIANGNFPVQFRMFDVSGCMLYQGNLDGGRSIDLAADKGLYFLYISQDGNSQAVKLIVQ
jgi:hypothetical protein